MQFFAIPKSDEIVAGSQAIVASAADGSFQIAVPPGKGHLLVFGPSPDYILDGSAGPNSRGRAGGWRTYAHDIIAYDANPDNPPRELIAELRPGKTVKGCLVGPDGKPVLSAAMLTTLEIEDARAT